MDYHNNGRDSPEYNEFRNKVLKRDKYKCQMPGCKKRKYKLQVHHIIPYGRSVYLRVESANGITLCKKHHDEIKGKESFFIQLFSKIVATNMKNE